MADFLFNQYDDVEIPLNAKNDAAVSYVMFYY
jgi:hypothetical protein